MATYGNTNAAKKRTADDEMVQSTSKRARTDAINLGKQDTGKAKYDKVIRDDSYLAVIAMHIDCAILLKYEVNCYNVSKWAQLTSTIFTCYKQYMQISNNTAKEREYINDDDLEYGTGLLSSNNVLYIVGNVMSCVMSGKTDVKQKELRGAVNSVLGLMNAYTRRRSEVRKFPKKLRGADVGGKATYMPLSQLGLEDSFANFTNAVSFSPYARSAIASTMSSTLIAIHLALNDNNSFRDKWIKLFNTHYSSLPGYEIIRDELASCGSKNVFTKRDVFKNLAGLEAFGVVRSQNKAYMPFVMFFRALVKSPTFVAMYQGAQGACATPAEVGARYKTEMFPDYIQNYDSSGHGMYYLWNENVEGITDNVKPKLALDFSEIMFHSVFGTHLEDISLVRNITGHEFKVRGDLVTIEEGESKKSCNLTLPKFIICAKLANAAMTGLIQHNEPQVARHAIFSGKCIAHYNPQSLLYKQLQVYENSLKYTRFGCPCYNDRTVMNISFNEIKCLFPPKVEQ